MKYSEIKNIEAIMAEKTKLKSEIARKEESFANRYTATKAYYTDSSNWFSIIKTLIFGKSSLSNPIAKFTLGFKVAKYLLKWFKR